MSKHFITAILMCLLTAASLPAAELPGGYAVVVSNETAADAEWAKVLDALKEKYTAEVISYDAGKVAEALPALQKSRPRYVCFLAKPTEADANFVMAAHRLSRKLDADLWTDCVWAILTGYDASDALKMVAEKPLTIRRVLGGTPLNLQCVESGVWFSEGTKNEQWVKEPGSEPQKVHGPDDTTKAVIDELTDGKAQLFITSGHATQKDWQMGYAYRNGYFVSEPGGKLAGKDTARNTYAIQSDEPRVHLAVGNCLIGNISDPDNCMAVGLMHSAGVRQMVGYVVPTWYGYMGWGMMDYFYLQPGRYTVAEAFFANQQALLHRLETGFPGESAKYDEAVAKTGSTRITLNQNMNMSDAAKEMGLKPQDLAGLLFDRDVVAIYGDPAWNARMADMQNAWSQTILEKQADGDGPQNLVYTLTLKKLPHDNADGNGSQRGGRPYVFLLPTRLAQNEDGTPQNLEILDGADLNPLVADDFVLIPSFEMEEGKEYHVRFRANGK